MASRSLGSLTLDLLVKTGAFEKGMDRAARTTDKRMREIEKRATAFGKAFGAGIAVAAIAATTAIVGALKSALEAADALESLSQKTGISAEKLSTLGYAATQSGADLDKLAIGLKFLSKNMTEALDASSAQGKVFAALGISVKDAEGNLRQASDVLPEVADRFKDLDNATLETSLALKLFGKSGTDLIEFLNLGGQGISEFEQRARDLGLEISGTTTKAADEFNDRLADVKAAAGALATKLLAELLPQMIELANKFIAFVGDGERVRSMADKIGTGFEVIGSVAASTTNLIGGMVDILAGFVGQALGFYNVVAGLATLDLSQIKAGQQGYAAGSGRIGKGFGNIVNPQKPRGFGQYNGPLLAESPTMQAAIAAEEAARIKKARDAQERIMKLLNDPTGKGSKTKTGSSKKSGPTEAEKELERLKQGYDQLTSSLKEQLALTGEVSEVEKLRYELANGELAKLGPAQKEQLLALQQSVEFRKAEFEAMEEAIKLEEKETEAKDAHAKAVKEQIADLEFELSIIGMTNIEREKAIALRYANVEAMSAEGQQISKLLEDIQKASENQQFVDDLKSGLADMFVDFVSGAKTAKEAFGDFADAIFKRALQFLADKAVQAMFDAFAGDGKGGGGSQGGSGGGWAQALASLFGGGRAAGGNVMAGRFYRVNENRPEMLTVGNNDYLMMGGKSGHVTPNPVMGGGGQINNFNFVGRVDRRTQDQVEAKLAQRSRRAISRNG